MRIRGVTTIAAYKEVRDQKIQEWIDGNFVKGAVTWELETPRAIRVTDKTGDSMVVQLDDISN